MKTGIFGGSFNPVHNGHIHLAEAVMNDLSLERIFFVPSRISPHRSMDEYASDIDRLNMLKLATNDNERFFVSDYELQSDRISYSIYTVEHFRRLYPDDELFLLVGSDMLMSFDKWYRFADILSNVSLAVASREDGDIDRLLKKADELSEFGRIYISRTTPLPVSSTEIRKNIVKNCNWSCYLNENVVQYIKSRGLYFRTD